MDSFTEAKIPDIVWKFVKKVIKHPIKAGILALLVWHFLSKNQPKKEKWAEVLDNVQFTYREKLEFLKGDSD